jgi:DNA-binding MarR family transcriptional regulator
MTSGTPRIAGRKSAVLIYLSVIDMSVAAEPTAALLAKILGRSNRALRYRTRAAHEALGLTDSEAELLRLLRRKPGLRVQDAALELGVASNSVSTLVKQLTRAGLVARTTDPLDARAAQLRITPEAESWLAGLRSTREDAVARALAMLDQRDRATVEEAVPALTRLSQALLSSAQ